MKSWLAAPLLMELLKDVRRMVLQAKKTEEKIRQAAREPIVIATSFIQEFSMRCVIFV